jgi:hypothetical protein
MPYRKNALEKAPRRKYLRAASVEAGESRRIPVSTYTASDSTSSARKMTTRSVAGCHQHHAGDGEQHQRVVLAAGQPLALDRRSRKRQRQQADHDQDARSRRGRSCPPPTTPKLEVS